MMRWKRLRERQKTWGMKVVMRWEKWRRCRKRGGVLRGFLPTTKMTMDLRRLFRNPPSDLNGQISCDSLTFKRLELSHLLNSSIIHNYPDRPGYKPNISVLLNSK